MGGTRLTECRSRAGAWSRRGGARAGNARMALFVLSQAPVRHFTLRLPGPGTTLSCPHSWQHSSPES